MTDEMMNYEEKANTDRLEFFYNEKVKIHLILKREISPGKKVYINGELIRRPSERLWILKDRELGEVRVSISEIAPNGVEKFTEVGG